MIAENERLIIVLGMAHSGTTILTHVLKQHPETMLFIDGSEAWIFENTYLPLEQAEPIQRLLTDYPNRRIILKRPWNEVWHGDWMAQQMPNAKFIYCYRSLEETAKSWSKPTSFVADQLRSGGIDYQRDFYHFCIEKAEAFSRQVPFYKRVFHPDFVAQPAQTIAMLAQWLGLSPFKFDVSQVGHDKDIKRLLSNFG